MNERSRNKMKKKQKKKRGTIHGLSRERRRRESTTGGCQVVVRREALVFCVVETVEGKKKFRMEKKEGKKEGESKEGTKSIDW